MQKVHLIGSISKFGDSFDVSCTNLVDVFKLLSCQLPGFRQYLIEAAEAGVAFELVKGSKIITEPEHLTLSLTDEDIFITEVPSGASGGTKIILAIAIVAFLVVNPLGLASLPAGTSLLGAEGLSGMAAFGVNMGLSVALSLAISGITELLTSTPKLEAGEATKDTYLFSGPTNNLKYGQAVPICYGELLIGGAPVSSYYIKDPLV